MVALSPILIWFLLDLTFGFQVGLCWILPLDFKLVLTGSYLCPLLHPFNPSIEFLRRNRVDIPDWSCCTGWWTRQSWALGSPSCMQISIPPIMEWWSQVLNANRILGAQTIAQIVQSNQLIKSNQSSLTLIKIPIFFYSKNLHDFYVFLMHKNEKFFSQI